MILQGVPDRDGEGRYIDKGGFLQNLAQLNTVDLLSKIVGFDISLVRPAPRAQTATVPTASRAQDPDELNIVTKVVSEPARLRDITGQKDPDDENFISLRN